MLNNIEMRDIITDFRKALKSKGWKIEDINSELITDIEAIFNSGLKNLALYEKKIKEYEKPKLTKCYNCGQMVEMISSGEFCPKCFC